ncbi:hypothetical protein EVJ32_10660 [Exiguobacterium sp. SH5S4]|uniref:hypothetical protein n=1 Tax=Exiguobacterium sp. SH5S4 TaxID=2510961 RepID=UPI001040DB7D|nr:hypothetical protein [Exiguobacterium sp. SH5S4]TCI25254.1 hypothetical protein EVJ32_10660 [Exiguobacterium sp. SH5S4]
MKLSIDDHRRFIQQKRARTLVKCLYHKGYKAKCIMHEEQEKKRVYFADCVKVILNGQDEGFVVRVKENSYQVIPNHSFFQPVDETGKLDLIQTNFDGLLKIIRETINGKKYSIT